MNSLRFKLFGLDWALIVAAALLIIIGFSTIASTVIAGEGFSTELLDRQILAVLLGVVVFFLISLFNYRDLTYLAPFLYLIGILALALVLIWGPEVRGARRWFIFGDFYLQPTEFVKPILIVSFAVFFSFVKEKINSFKVLFFSVTLLGIPLTLIFLEPDLGTAVIVFTSWLTMLFFSPIKLKTFLLCLLFLVVIGPASWFFLADYQKMRVISFLDPTSDPLGAGYNLIQSIIAIGSGQLLGRGWGRGTQSHLKFLPEQHTDFIFATWSEESGFVGVLVIFALFTTLLFRGLTISQKSTDFLGAQLSIGVTALLFVQVFINVGMNLGLLPVTGVPLPLVSYGGSSSVGVLISLGLLQSVAVNRRV